MRRRGRGGGYGFHSQRNFRNEGRNSSARGRSDGDSDAGPSGNNYDRDDRGRGGRGRPPGLRGRAIGLYYRDRNRANKQKQQQLGVSLDPRKEEQIWKLLDSTRDERPRTSPKQERISPDRYSFLPPVSIYHSESEFSVKEEKTDDCDVQPKQERSPDRYSSLSPSFSTHHSNSEFSVNVENADDCDVKTKQERSPDHYSSLPPVSKCHSDSEFSVKVDKTDDCDVQPSTSNSNRTNGGDSYKDRYSHIRDSSFKRKFLQNITETIETNLERSLLVKAMLSRDEDLDRLYKEELLSKRNSRHYQKMMEFRQKLPSYKKQNEILDLLEHNQVIVISGETGCGKTTQVGQFILDDHIMKNKGSTCHIVCTQPRRISATSVAARVADERDEPCGAASVGYQIRLEKELPRRKGSMLFCTTGILLQRMETDPALREVSHLVLDEIHERDVTCDFVLTILKDVIPKRPDLKIILMSATLNAEQFAKYFGNCPCLNIPGFTYPVKEFYLEDALEMTRFVIKPAPEPTAKWKKFTKFGKTKARKIEAFRDLIGPYIRNLQAEGKYSSSVLEMLNNPESEDINLELIAALIHHICLRKGEGAILVFLPGWDNISTLHKLLTESGRFPSSRFLIIPLHSLMPTVIQKSVFDRPPNGVRKIVIATNIAETSITIDDVVFVIDSGKIKMKNFDVENNISTLKAEWVSLANARQRRGRAGRVQPGECYHMYTRAREMILEDYPLPEIMRTRLEEVILQLKILQLGKTSPFLERVMDPPDPRAIDLSIKLLENLNALDADENLTPLGFHLARLPLDPQTGKMILMGALFSCVDPIFSVAASLSFKDPFHVPLGREEEVNRRKMELSHGQNSDHLVLAEALRQWETAEETRRGRDFCWQYFLSSNTLSLLRDMKGQFAEHLYNMNFLKSKNPKAEDANINSHNISLVKAIVCAGLYPNVAIIRSVRRKKGGFVIIKLHTPEDGSVCIHPRSINERQTKFESPFLLYHLKLKSSSIYLHDTTMVYPLALLFFGKGVNFYVENGQETIAVDKSISFKCEEKTANLVKELRKRLDQLLEYKITHPGTINWSQRSSEGVVLRAIIELITSEDKSMMLVAQDEGFSD